jgi:primosomal replication protein N''
MVLATLQQQQLDKFSLRIQQLAALGLQVNSSHTATISYKLRDRALFYPGLFCCKGQDLSPYIAELEHNMMRLTQRFLIEDSAQIEADLKPAIYADMGDEPQVLQQVLLEKVAHQFRALNAVLQQCNFYNNNNNKKSNTTATGNKPDDAAPDYEQIAKKILCKSHHLYRKLAQQLEYERRLQLMIHQQTDPTQRQQTQQRLQRCQTATKKVRQQVQRYEQKKDLG